MWQINADLLVWFGRRRYSWFLMGASFYFGTCFATSSLVLSWCCCCCCCFFLHWLNIFRHSAIFYSSSLKLFTFLLPLYRYGFDSSPSVGVAGVCVCKCFHSDHPTVICPHIQSPFPLPIPIFIRVTFSFIHTIHVNFESAFSTELWGIFPLPFRWFWFIRIHTYSWTTEMNIHAPVCAFVFQ